jgi:hypothetical protein
MVEPPAHRRVVGIHRHRGVADDEVVTSGLRREGQRRLVLVAGAAGLPLVIGGRKLVCGVGLDHQHPGVADPGGVAVVFRGVADRDGLLAWR